ncbi:MAG: response regulator transcription factor [Polyangia bacterium]|jgi:two-component system response regulator RegX3|nr:response regulator transcription factor [Polyangia bacterium]
MTRLLLCEDDRLIGEMVRLNLVQLGYEVTWLRDGAEAEREIRRPGYALALLDVNLPGCSGFEIARSARSDGLELPILMLTARSDTASKVTGLDSGADDYLTKPFDLPELAARVRALLRRAGAGPLQDADRLLGLGPFRVDLQSGEAETLSGPATLPPDELGLLTLLSRRRGQDLASHELLEELLLAPNCPASAEALRDTIARLRARFEPDPERPRHFRAVRGGYRFEA